MGGAAMDIFRKLSQHQGITDPGPLEYPVLWGCRQLRPGEDPVWLYVRTKDLESLEWFKRAVNDETAWFLGSLQKVTVSPSPVLEPCKVRIITMGDAILYHRALCLQQFLAGTIKRDSLFQWTGKPITVDDWDKAYPGGWVRSKLESGWTLVSGDYSAATDNLDPRLSEAVFRAICGTVCVGGGPREPMWLTPWAQLGLSCLTRHVLDYHGKKVEQTWGQLMGSPVSFPVLNLANAAAAAVGLGYDPWGDSTSVRAYLSSFGVHTNGDDIVFMCPESSYGHWQKTVTACGLEPSPGKNYTSSEFLVMNSETRSFGRIPGPTLDGGPLYGWRFEGFLNLPLMFGMDAKGPEAGQVTLYKKTFLDLGPLARALVRGVEGDTLTQRMVRFAQYHSSILARAPPGVHWEVPEGLGGLGLPRFRTEPMSERLLRRATYVSCLETRQRLSKTSKPTVPDPRDSPLAVALRRIRAGENYVEMVRPSTREWDELLPPRLKGQATPTALEFAKLITFYRMFPEHFQEEKEAAVTRSKSSSDDFLVCAIERRYARKAQQINMRAASAVKLSAMREVNIFSWKDPYQLEKICLSPDIDLVLPRLEESQLARALGRPD